MLPTRNRREPRAGSSSCTLVSAWSSTHLRQRTLTSKNKEMTPERGAPLGSSLAAPGLGEGVQCPLNRNGLSQKRRSTVKPDEAVGGARQLKATYSRSRILTGLFSAKPRLWLRRPILPCSCAVRSCSARHHPVSGIYPLPPRAYCFFSSGFALASNGSFFLRLEANYERYSDSRSHKWARSNRARLPNLSIANPCQPCAMSMR